MYDRKSYYTNSSKNRLIYIYLLVAFATAFDTNLIQFDNPVSGSQRQRIRYQECLIPILSFASSLKCFTGFPDNSIEKAIGLNFSIDLFSERTLKLCYLYDFWESSQVYHSVTPIKLNKLVYSYCPKFYYRGLLMYFCELDNFQNLSMLFEVFLLILIRCLRFIH